MALNYARLSAMAQRLIEANGRPCDFSRKGTAPADAAKPWRAPQASSGAGGPVTYSNVVAVVTSEWYGDQPNNGARRPGQMVLLVAASSFPGDAVDLLTLDRVDDGTTVWKICKMLPVMPGATPLIFQSDLEG